MGEDKATWIIEAYVLLGQPDLERRIGELSAQYGGRFDYRSENSRNVELTYEFDDESAAQLALNRIVTAEAENVHVEGPYRYG